MPSFFRSLRKQASLKILSKALVIGLTVAAAHSASAQTVTNFSFESPVVASYAYEVIDGWTATGGGTIGGGSHGVGLSDSSGPFANNGTIPDGFQVSFLQTNGSADTTLLQTITGLIPGNQYVVSFFDNSRSYGANPILNVSFGGQAIAGPQTIAPVGGLNPYNSITGTAFTATSTSADLLFAASLAAPGDASALIDGVTIQDIGPAAVPEASSVISMGLLLALGLGGVAVVRRKRKA